MRRGGGAAALRLAALALVAMASGCAHAPQGSGGSRAAAGIAPDSITTALWHMDIPFAEVL